MLEALEDRCLPSSYTAGSAADLIADINAANALGGSNTITLKAGVRYSLTAVDNTTYGPTGLPVVTSNLTIADSGDILERSTANKTPAFRVFAVAPGGSLNLENLTVQGGLAQSSIGGAIYNLGTLSLSGVTVQNNVAQSGGGIYSTGSLTVSGGAIQNNKALGASPYVFNPDGGSAFGGGVYTSGSATFDDVTIAGNLAQGADGATGINGGGTAATAGNGGGAVGGGVYTSGSASFNGVTVSGNQAQGGNGANGGWLYSFSFDGPGYRFAVGGGRGGVAEGGGVAFLGTTLSVTDCTVSSNSVVGGNGGSKGPNGHPAGSGGNGLGGGLYVAGTTATLTMDIDSANTAQGGKAGGSSATDGAGEGGAVYIPDYATVYIDAYTLSHFSGNKASTAGIDIYGTYNAI
jgi:predicted outer membrane repeat protein